MSVVWAWSAMAAQSAGAPIPKDLYVSSAGSVRFAEGKTGTVALICPLTADVQGKQLRSLRLTYRDGGSTDTSRVSASLRRVRCPTVGGPAGAGQVETVPRSEVSSNDPGAPNSGPNSWATHQSGAPGAVMNHTVDLENFYYYVQINLIRTNTVTKLGAIGVHLID